MITSMNSLYVTFSPKYELVVHNSFKYLTKHEVSIRLEGVKIVNLLLAGRTLLQIDCRRNCQELESSLYR